VDEHWPPIPRRGLRLLRLGAWSAVVGLTWLLLGQQLQGQPVVHLDLTGVLPGATLVRQQPAAPTRPPSAPHRQAPWRQAAPRLAPAGSPAAARAVTFALNQQGKRYRWGAEGPEAYDCSGLVWLAWQHAGLNWERMSAAGQWAWLHQHHRQVPATQLQPGDLLFYAHDPNDPASIHHVAMATGDGRMVEAYAPGVPVRVTSVRWEGLYAAARPLPVGAS
jgi:cell wall-associated NlpC family hydrolase